MRSKRRGSCRTHALFFALYRDCATLPADATPLSRTYLPCLSFAVGRTVAFAFSRRRCAAAHAKSSDVLFAISLALQLSNVLRIVIANAHASSHWLRTSTRIRLFYTLRFAAPVCSVSRGFIAYYCVFVLAPSMPSPFLLALCNCKRLPMHT